MYLAYYPEEVDQALGNLILKNFGSILDGAIGIASGFPLHVEKLLLDCLPADVATSSVVEVFTIGYRDRRKALRGKHGLRAAVGSAGLPAGSFVGVYGGRTMFQSAYRKWKLTPPPGTDVLTHELFVDSYAASAIHFNVGRWAMDHGLTTFPGKSRTRDDDDNGIIVSAAGCGNETAYINDPLVYPMEQSAETLGANTCMCEIVLGAWPFLALFTTKDVMPGEELLYEYGKAFWDFVEEDMLRIENMKRTSYGSEGRLQQCIQGTKLLETACGRSSRMSGFRAHLEHMVDELSVARRG